MLAIKKVDSSHPRRRRLRLRLNKVRLRQGLSILPNIFTLANAFFGFCSVIFSAQGDFVIAAYFILVSALMDGLDGRLARYANSTSEFGLQLDSLCDAVSFGLAPSVLMYLWQFKNLQLVGLMACGLFLLAGLLRLARFNLIHRQQESYSLGVPITVAGSFLPAVLLNTTHIVFKFHHTILLALFIIFLAACMVSKIPFPTLKNVSKSTAALVAGCIGAFLIIMGFMKVLMCIFIIYFLLAFGKIVR